MTSRPSFPRRIATMVTATTVAALIAAALAGRPAHAQASGDGFAFGAPRNAFTLRAGLAQASARGDVFDFTTSTLTVGRGDFSGLALAGELALGRPNSRLDVVLGVGYASSSVPSDFRDWIGEDDRPIEQVTTFRRVPLTVGARAYLVPRGRSLGELAWVPARVAPYVGAGVGATWYTFSQVGEFVDFETMDGEPAVFPDEFRSTGWGATAYGGAGLDYTLTPAMALTVDARYIKARAGANGDFDGFDRVDLSGLSTTLGITFRF